MSDDEIEQSSRVLGEPQKSLSWASLIIPVTAISMPNCQTTSGQIP